MPKHLNDWLRNQLWELKIKRLLFYSLKIKISSFINLNKEININYNKNKKVPLFRNQRLCFYINVNILLFLEI